MIKGYAMNCIPIHNIAVHCSEECDAIFYNGDGEGLGWLNRVREQGGEEQQFISAVMIIIKF